MEALPRRSCHSSAILAAVLAVASGACETSTGADAGQLDAMLPDDAVANDDATGVDPPFTLCGEFDLTSTGVVRGPDGPVLHVLRNDATGAIPWNSELHAVSIDGALRPFSPASWRNSGEIVHVLDELRYVRRFCRDNCSTTRTVDGGQTWSPLSLPGTSWMYASFEGALFAIEEDQLIASQDVGGSWEPVGALPFTPAGWHGWLVDDDGRAVLWDENPGASPRLARREADGAWTVVPAPCAIERAVTSDGGLLAWCRVAGVERAVRVDETLRSTVEIESLDGLLPFGSAVVALERMGPGAVVYDVSAGRPFPVVATLPAYPSYTLSWHDRVYWVAFTAACASGRQGVVVGVLSP